VARRVARWLRQRFCLALGLARCTDETVAGGGRRGFLLKDDGALVVARANPAGLQPLKTYQVADSSTWAQPVLSGNRVFVKDVSHLTLWTVN
jgi:hypothetical protein